MVFNGRSQSCDRNNLEDTLVACVSSVVSPSDDTVCPVTAYCTCSYVMMTCCLLLVL